MGEKTFRYWFVSSRARRQHFWGQMWYLRTRKQLPALIKFHFQRGVASSHGQRILQPRNQQQSALLQGEQLSHLLQGALQLTSKFRKKVCSHPWEATGLWTAKCLWEVTSLPFYRWRNIIMEKIRWYSNEQPEHKARKKIPVVIWTINFYIFLALLVQHYL